MANFFIGTDVGTSGTKSVLIDDQGKVLGSKYITYPLITPRPGWAEHKPDDYWNAVADTMKSCIEQAHVDPADIKGLAVSALAPSCILVDENNNPLQNGHIWMDRRGTAQAQWIKDNIGYDAFKDKNPNPIDPYYNTIKLMWERDNRPELYNKAKKVVTAIGYPVLKLTGEAVCSYNDACFFGVGFDLVNRKWDEEYIERLGLDINKFPKLYSMEEVVGYVTAEAAERTGLKQGTPVVAGLIDAGGAAVSGGLKPNYTLTITMGTAGCMGISHEEPNFAPNLITTVSGRTGYSTGAAISACGSLTRYFRDEFAQAENEFAKGLGISPFDIMTLEAEKVPAGSGGLIVLPYFMGERSPIWDPLARGMVFGMSLTHTKAHLLRAFMEGAAYGLYHNYECMLETGIHINQPIYLSEGGAQSNLWRQIVADVFNVPCEFETGSKGAPLGDALLAGACLGYIKDLSSISKDNEGKVVYARNEPDAERHEMYMQYYSIYRKLYENTKEQYRELAVATGNL